MLSLSICIASLLAIVLGPKANRSPWAVRIKTFPCDAIACCVISNETLSDPASTLWSMGAGMPTPDLM